MIIKRNGRIVKKHYSQYMHRGKVGQAYQFVRHIKDVNCLICLKHIVKTNPDAHNLLIKEKLTRSVNRYVKLNPKQKTEARKLIRRIVREYAK